MSLILRYGICHSVSRYVHRGFVFNGQRQGLILCIPWFPWIPGYSRRRLTANEGIGQCDWLKSAQVGQRSHDWEVMVADAIIQIYNVDG